MIEFASQKILLAKRLELSLFLWDDTWDHEHGCGFKAAAQCY
jgi:hypothetical protein